MNVFSNPINPDACSFLEARSRRFDRKPIFNVSVGFNGCGFITASHSIGRFVAARKLRASINAGERKASVASVGRFVAARKLSNAGVCQRSITVKSCVGRFVAAIKLCTSNNGERGSTTACGVGRFIAARKLRASINGCLTL